MNKVANEVKALVLYINAKHGLKITHDDIECHGTTQYKFCNDVYTAIANTSEFIIRKICV